MTTYRPGEIILTVFPFTAGVQSKLRPALVLLDTGDADLIVARITTRRPQVSMEVAVADWR